MKIKWKSLIISVAIPLLVGGLSALITRNSMKDFENLNKPPLSPPAIAFPIVWTILFILMGIASYLVYQNGGNSQEKTNALKLYGVQLVFNFFWSVIFFNFKAYNFAFIWLLALLILIICTAVSFYKISKNAGYLFIPYILWATFAVYLNLTIAVLN